MSRFSGFRNSWPNTRLGILRCLEGWDSTWIRFWILVTRKVSLNLWPSSPRLVGGSYSRALTGRWPAAPGCAGLRRLSLEIGEVKRVYVRPAFRRNGVGRALIEAVIAAARLIGYRKLRLETASFMVGAQALYRSLGFDLIEFYREIADVMKYLGVFMELNLE